MCQRVSVTQRLFAAGCKAPVASREEEKPSNSINKARVANFGMALPSAAAESEPAVVSAGSVRGAAYRLPPQGLGHASRGDGSVCHPSHQTTCQDGLITTAAGGGH